jgi:Phosphotransferase enzyme family
MPRQMTVSSSAIAEETALGLIAAFCARDGLRQPHPRIAGQWLGSINQVFRIRIGESEAVLRVRHNEQNFQYEKGVFKEVIIAQLLAAFERDKRADLDKAISEIWEGTHCGGSREAIAFPAGADILHYDFTKLAFSGPWAIFTWAGDALNGRFGSNHAARLGGMISQIHNLKFERAGLKLHSLHLDGAGLVAEWIREAGLRNENTGRVISEDGPLRRKLGVLRDEIGRGPVSFVLCHNDLQCTNITEDGQSMHILDWDNAQIAPRELDFVKLAHWSVIGKDGYFEPDPAIFSSFCAGYGVSEEAIKHSATFRLAEILWLFRVYEFATRTVGVKPFWPASRYARLLAERL